VAFETFNPQLGRPDYYYTTEGLGARDGDANNPGGLVDPDNFKRLAWDPRIVIASRTGDWSILNGMPYDVLDRSGNVIGQKLIEGMGKEDNTDQMVGMAAAALATAGAAGWLGGGSAAGAEAAGAGALDTAAFEGIGSSALGETTATMGASGSGLGSGLSGTGLSMGGGTTGLTATTGSGLSLTGSAVAPGMMTAAAPGAGAIGAGLGTGFAGGAGTLLGPAALAGTYTLANGSILPALTSSLPSIPPVPPTGSGPGGATPSTPGLPKIPGVTDGFQWTDLIGPAANLIGGGMASNAASDAADKQIQAAREAQALQEPWRQAGIKGLNRLQELLAIGGDPNSAGYGSAAADFAEREPTVAPFAQQAPQWRDFTLDDFQKDPGYDFRLNQGTNALSRAYAGKGRFLSGAAMKGITRFGQDYASGEFGKAFDRYQTGYGNRVGDFNSAYSRYNTDRRNTMDEYQNRFARFQTNKASKLAPFQSLAGIGQTTAQSMGGDVRAAGDAAAAGRIGSNNAIADALSGAYKTYRSGQDADANNAMMRALLTARGVAL
jgi:hypothetical protein